MRFAPYPDAEDIMERHDSNRDAADTRTGNVHPDRRPEGKEGAGRTDNDHQKTVQGKNQRGPDEKIGRDAGGNDGSKGQNIRDNKARDEHDGKQNRERGH